MTEDAEGLLPWIPMNRRTFLLTPVAAAATTTSRQSGVERGLEAPQAAPREGAPGVAVLLVDTDRVIAPIDRRIYGHFLEHINHSVEDGLFAEQIQGAGFEGKDFATHWTPFADRGRVEVAEVEFKNGQKSARLRPEGGRAGIRQGRIFVDAGREYDGSVWIKPEAGRPQLSLRVTGSQGAQIASVPLPFKGIRLAGGSVPLHEPGERYAGVG